MWYKHIIIRIEAWRIVVGISDPNDARIHYFSCHTSVALAVASLLCVAVILFLRRF
jgi:hypothetical protein